jgi:DNA-directed RNA polymerase II subunit RPB2
MSTHDEMPWRIISAMFNHRADHLVAHHIDSYNRFVSQGLKEVISRANPLTVVRDHDPKLDEYRYRCEVYIGGRDGSLIQFHKPTYMDQGVQKPLYPNIARLRNASYSTYITQTVEVRIVTHPEGGERKEEWQRFEDVPLMSLPIMLGGENCYLQGLPRMMRASFGEGRNDPGGYFIIDGKEKVIVPQETFANNMLNVRMLNSDEFSYAVDIRSISADPSKPQRNLSIRMVKDNNKQEGGQIVVKLPNVRQPVPLFTLMRALGMESDKEIVEAILGVGEEYSRYQRVLIPCVHDAGRIYTEEAAQAYIGTFTKGKGRTHALEILSDYLLPHIGEANFREKALFIGYMVLRMLRVYSGADPETDRDSFAMKRVELSGDLLFDLAREYYKLDSKSITTRIDKEFYYHEAVYKENLASLVRNNVKAFFSDRILDAGVRKAFKGSWGSAAHTKRDGVVQDLNRLSFNSAISQRRKLNLPLDASAKVVGPRFLHTTQWGYIDPVDTPDGGNVGLHKHLAISTMVTPGSSSEPVMRAVEKHGLLRLAKATAVQRANMTKFFLDGYWIGFVNKPAELINRLHLLRYNNLIDTLTSCSYNRMQNEVHILVSPGRLTRPVLGVYNGRPIYTHSAQTRLLQTNNPRWRELTKGLATKEDGSVGVNPSASEEELLATAAPLSYIDAQETNTMLLVVSEEEFTPRHNGIEIHPSLILGVMGNQIVYPENNQLPRDLFSCGQSKQGVSVFSTAFNNRIDKSALMLHYGQIPLVKSRYLDYINHEENPYGVNAIVAIMSYSGYNVEDAVLLNRGSVERGLFSTTYYSMYESREESEKVAGTAISSQFMNTDDPDVLGRKAGYDYAGLDAMGFLPVNTQISEKQIVIGKAASSVNAPGEFRDQSVGTKKGAKGVVDKVYISEGEDGFRIAKMRVREWRQPAQGDKMCSRCGQKGTAGLILDEDDMPFMADGTKPDIIINPHALPSRMTIGQLVESLVGRVSVEYGKFGDCTAFENKGQKVKEYGEMLAKAGFSATGNATLYDGASGEQLESQIFIGPTYYMRLKHMTKDKINHRGRGPRTQLTRQPVQGRANDGGLRIGEMERDGLLGHGMADMLQESMMNRSDDFKLAVCNTSGTIAIYNEARDVFISPYQDGPLTFDKGEEGSVNNTTVQRHGTSFSIVRVPYSFKLLWQELQSLNIAMYVITDENVDKLTRKPKDKSPADMRKMGRELVKRLKETGEIVKRDKRPEPGDTSAYYGAEPRREPASYAAQPYDYGSGDGYRPSSPTYQAYEPSSPPYRPGSPTYEPRSPEYRPRSPTYEPRSPEYRPRSPSFEPRSPTPLPPGWSSANDPATGNTYYFNMSTGVTQWERPEFEPESPRLSPDDEGMVYQPPEEYSPRSPTPPSKEEQTVGAVKLPSPGDTPPMPKTSPSYKPESPTSISSEYSPSSPVTKPTPKEVTPEGLPSGWRELPPLREGDPIVYRHVPTGVVQLEKPTGQPEGVEPLPSIKQED